MPHNPDTNFCLRVMVAVRKHHDPKNLGWGNGLLQPTNPLLREVRSGPGGRTEAMETFACCFAQSTFLCTLRPHFQGWDLFTKDWALWYKLSIKRIINPADLLPGQSYGSILLIKIPFSPDNPILCQIDIKASQHAISFVECILSWPIQGFLDIFVLQLIGHTSIGFLTGCFLRGLRNSVITMKQETLKTKSILTN